MKSVNPTKVDPQSTLFRISAADVGWMLEAHGYSLSNMDPHVWARVKKAVDATMSNLWADAVSEAVEQAVKQ